MITILLLISRPNYLDQVFACLEYLECDIEQTNLLGIVDGDYRLFETARNKIEMSKFNERLCVEYKSKERMKNYDIAHRRRRIADIHNFAKQFVQKSDYIFTVEDDTTFGVGTLKKLQKDYLMLPFAGAIQGYQVGRHGINHYGVWEVDDIYTPTQITSQTKPNSIVVENMRFPSEKLAKCDGGGLYCMLTKAETYMAHEFKPFEDNGLGPDVDYWIELRRQGFENYTDWSVPCDHHTKDEIINPRSAKTQQVEFRKVEGRWRQKSLK